MQHPRNARFWIYHKEGWVKVTLKPGQKIEFYEGGPTDEGWFRQYESFEYDPEYGVIHECSDDGADCDGRFGHFGEWACNIDDLAALPEEELMEWRNGEFVGTGEVLPPRPDWQVIDRWQRDYEAEKAGY